MTRPLLSLLTLLALISGVLPLAARGREADYPPRPAQAINDFAGLLNPETSSRLEKLSQVLQEKTGAAVVTATVSSIAPETVEGYAVKLFEKWGIGEKGKDNGVLILVAVAERKARIEVGYGLEGTIPDAEAHRIIQDLLLPNFKRGDFNRGIDLAVQAVIGRIAEENNLEIEGLAPEPASEKTPFNPTATIFLFLFVLFPIFRLLLFSRRGHPGGRSGTGGFWTGSGGSRGGFGGGFGGFGGGSSGGGGASGGW